MSRIVKIYAEKWPKFIGANIYCTYSQLERFSVLIGIEFLCFYLIYRSSGKGDGTDPNEGVFDLKTMIPMDGIR